MRSVGLELPLERLSAAVLPERRRQRGPHPGRGRDRGLIANLNHGAAEFSPSAGCSSPRMRWSCCCATAPRASGRPALQRRGHVRGPGRRRRHRHHQGRRDRRGRADSEPIRRRRRRQPQPDSRAARDRDARTRPALRSATIYFRADCREFLAGTELGVIYVTNPAVRGFFRFERTGTSGFLVVNTLGDPTVPGTLDVTRELTTERAAGLVQAAIGVPDFPVQIDDVAEWVASADVAERYQAGRIFLAGDAAHVVPPNGGSAATPASTTRTISPGSSRWSCTARPTRRCSRATTPSVGRSAS